MVVYLTLYDNREFKNEPTKDTFDTSLYLALQLLNFKLLLSILNYYKLVYSRSRTYSEANSRKLPT